MRTGDERYLNAGSGSSSMKRTAEKVNHLDKAFLATLIAVFVYAVTRLIVDLARWIG